MEGDGDSRVALERRIDEEVARVREAARADVATVREEARAALERETRLLRDMRDRAQHGADSAAAELKACRQELVDAAARFRGLQHKADVESSTATAEIRIMAADADRAKARPSGCQLQLINANAPDFSDGVHQSYRPSLWLDAGTCSLVASMHLRCTGKAGRTRCPCHHTWHSLWCGGAE